MPSHKPKQLSTCLEYDFKWNFASRRSVTVRLITSKHWALVRVFARRRLLRLRQPFWWISILFFLLQILDCERWLGMLHGSVVQRMHICILLPRCATVLGGAAQRTPIVLLSGQIDFFFFVYFLDRKCCVLQSYRQRLLLIVCPGIGFSLAENGVLMASKLNNG